MSKKELVITENQSPMSAMQIALDNKVDLAKVEKMIELQQKWDVIEAKKAFIRAMVDFKSNPPEIIKDKTVGYTTKAGDFVGYSHATLANVTNTINSELSKYGFSSAWKQSQANGQITVTCVITHEKGHSESTSLSANADVSGGKNAIQAIGSTVTYLSRYTLLALTGLATHDQDDDGYGSEPTEYINDKQKSNIVDMIAATESDEKEFLKYIGADSIDTIPEKSYKKALVALKIKEEQNKK